MGQNGTKHFLCRQRLTWSSPLQMAYRRRSPVPRKGWLPDNKTWSRTPALHMSEALPCGRPRTTSGLTWKLSIRRPSRFFFETKHALQITSSAGFDFPGSPLIRWNTRQDLPFQELPRNCFDSSHLFLLIMLLKISSTSLTHHIPPIIASCLQHISLTLVKQDIQFKPRWSSHEIKNRFE